MKHVDIRMHKTTISHNESYEGERLETKIERIVNNKEPITDGAPIIYTERKDGVKPETNIRTDRFDIALDAMDVVSRTYRGRRAEKAEIKSIDGTKNDSGAESTQATE